MGGVTSLVYGCGYAGVSTTGVYFDDLILASAEVGDYRIDAHYMTGDSAELTAGGQVGGTTGSEYTAVNEHPEPDDAASYIELGNVGDRQTFTHEALKNTGAPIVDVMLVIDARLAQAGYGSIGGTIYDDVAIHDSTGHGLTTGFSRARSRWATNPGTGLSWTESGFNAAEVGAVKTY